MGIFKKPAKKVDSVKAPSAFERVAKIFAEVKEKSISDWEKLRARVRIELT